ncbi:MAG: alcohol dehydrogenase family protein [Candidatus Puniceispirillales bacterium]
MPATVPALMKAVHLVGHGGFESLVFRDDVPVPAPGDHDVLIKLTAAGVNNTDINTRIGWYSKAVTGDTNAGGEGGFDEVDADDASWSGESLVFPRIQGADVSGEIVAVGAKVDQGRIGERVLCRTMMDVPGKEAPFSCWTMGSECDGGFAQYARVPAVEAFPIKTDLSDIELAAIPCAYSTAENMLFRVRLGAERVLITGASGGVGSAAVQLAKQRGCEVIAIAAEAKADALKALGADQVVDRHADLLAVLGRDAVDVVVDLVAGSGWPTLLELLRRGGRYITAGAIAGPIVELDVRTLYLKDLSLLGSTYQDRAAFENLIALLEKGAVRPPIAATFPLHEIAKAQAMFLEKNFVGKIVLTIPQD